MWFVKERSPLDEARKRGVKFLLHSTHLYENLPQILQDGKVHTARSLEATHGREKAVRFLHDPRRYEQLAVGLDYINCSLSLPNFELLYHRSRSDWQAEWVHLELELSLLDRADTLFSPQSAAADFGKQLQAGRAGFMAMLAEQVGDFTREGLNADVPTHPQAEILIRGSLDWQHVRGIFVSSGSAAEEVSILCARHERKTTVTVAPQLFVWPKRLIWKNEERRTKIESRLGGQPAKEPPFVPPCSKGGD